MSDPEALFTAAMKAQGSVVGLCGNRIGTRLGGTFPALRITLAGGASPPTEGISSAVLQWESWGSSEADAALLAAAVYAAVKALRGTYSAGVIVSAWNQGHYFHSRDQETNRDRYLGQMGLLYQ
jgi:hypothetical protein